MSRLKTYQELLEEYGFNKIPYPVLLQTNEWNNCRAKIIIRDNCTCQSCSNSNSLRIYASGLVQRVELDDGSIDYRPFTLDEPLAIVSEYSIHVHHKYYIKDLLPWEYKDEELITYCPDCHMKWHQENTVKYYVRNGNGELIEESYQTCDRCEGTGHLPQYKHVDNGICFKCGGRTFLSIEK